MLLCVGDSLTGAPGAWPVHIRQPTYVRAVPGSKISALPEQLADAPPAAATVISTGTNDALDWANPLDLDVLGAVVEQAPGRVAFLGPMLCLPFHNPTYWWYLHDRRKRILTAIRSTGAAVIDQRVPLWCWRRDGIHPNKWGAELLAMAVQEWLEREGVRP